MKLSDIRKSKGMKAQELADKLGVSYVTIYRWETGQQEPTIKMAYRIADALGVTPETIIRCFDHEQ